jgi:hypothetical protein
LAAPTFSTGEVIECTPEHPFYVEGVGFTPAGRLGIGTSIVTRAGPAVQVTKVERHDASATVYNFTVEGSHTYFVGQTGLWVHNECGPTLTEAKNLMRRWAADPETGRIADSIRYHFGEHGSEVGADNVWQYLRKADNFGSLRGQAFPSRVELRG